MTWQFEFNQWHEAFETFYRQKAKDNSMCLVISTAPYASGYWIERDAQDDEFTKVYRSVNAVRRLEQRVKRRNEKEPRPMSVGVII